MKKQSLSKRLLSSIPPAMWILFTMILFFSLRSENYFKVSNLQNILVQSIPLFLLAMAQTLVILTEGVDLSLGAQVSLVTVMWVFLLKQGVPFLVAALIPVAISIVVGAINGFIVSKWRIPPFISTFGMQGILYSIALLITKGASIYHSTNQFQLIAESKIIGINLTVWISIVLFLITWVVLYKTKLGIWIFGLGGNKEALVLSGVDTIKASMLVYAYAGFLAAMCGLLITCRLESGQPIVGQGWEFEAVAATILGGTSFREGKGGLYGTIFGVLLITILKNGLNLLHLFAIYQNAIIGSVILLAIIVDLLVRRTRNIDGVES